MPLPPLLPPLFIISSFRRYDAAIFSRRRQTGATPRAIASLHADSFCRHAAFPPFSLKRAAAAAMLRRRHYYCYGFRHYLCRRCRRYRHFSLSLSPPLLPRRYCCHAISFERAIRFSLCHRRCHFIAAIATPLLAFRLLTLRHFRLPPPVYVAMTPA